MAAQYGVFISHCGTDCKRDFAVWLRKELEAAGIRCFLDETGLQLGDVAFEQMLAAMRTAHYGVAILSAGFFLREWCIQELRTFLDRKNLIPIFLGINVGQLDAILEEATAKEIWKDFQQFPLTKEDYTTAARSVTNHTGSRLEALDNRWDNCIEQVKSRLLHLLGELEGGVCLSGQELLFGLDDHVVKLRQLLGIAESVGGAGPVTSAKLEESATAAVGRHEREPKRRKQEVEASWHIDAREVGIVGVKGMGGIGKTTLAKRIYDDPAIRASFAGRICWVEVNQRPSQERICNLQASILQKLCGVEMKAGSPTEGLAVLHKRLGAAKVLVCLDNVWDDEGSTDVVRPESLGPGTRIVKTTRIASAVGKDGIPYDLDVLPVGPSWKLFCWHAFAGQEPPDYLEPLVHRAVRACGGLPLALEVCTSESFSSSAKDVPF
jgi:hypothetical protein